MFSALLFGLTVIATLAVIALLVCGCCKLGKKYPDLRPVLFSIFVGIMVLNLPTGIFSAVNSTGAGNTAVPWERGDDLHNLMVMMPKIILALLVINAAVAIVKMIRNRASN